MFSINLCLHGAYTDQHSDINLGKKSAGLRCGCLRATAFLPAVSMRALAIRGGVHGQGRLFTIAGQANAAVHLVASGNHMTICF